MVALDMSVLQHSCSLRTELCNTFISEAVCVCDKTLAFTFCSRRLWTCLIHSAHLQFTLRQSAESLRVRSCVYSSRGVENLLQSVRL